jgi:hypothetical protein
MSQGSKRTQKEGLLLFLLCFGFRISGFGFIPMQYGGASKMHGGIPGANLIYFLARPGQHTDAGCGLSPAAAAR